jgi:hypothetical protein
MYKVQLNAQRLSCLVEHAPGTALLLKPGLAVVMIVGSSLPNGGNQMAQLFGAAIICLGLSCWSNSPSSCHDEKPSIGLTTYNIISGLLLQLRFLRRCKGLCGTPCSPASHRTRRRPT